MLLSLYQNFAYVDCKQKISWNNDCKNSKFSKFPIKLVKIKNDFFYVHKFYLNQKIVRSICRSNHLPGSLKRLQYEKIGVILLNENMFTENKTTL